MGNYFSSEGGYEIHACADRDNAIREISEFNNCNFEILNVGLVSCTLATMTGLNLYGRRWSRSLPSRRIHSCPKYLTATKIDGWDRTTQMWKSAIDIGGGFIIGDDFPLEERDGFFARVTNDDSVVFEGRRVKSHECTYLETGLI